jgi:DNA-binding response OmpR family regulator
MTANSLILVVDDEKHLAAGIRFNLEAEGYRVLTAADGYTAIEEVRKHGEDISLVILDLMLPGKSGYDVCEELRKDGFRMPVLMLSARSLPEDRSRGFDVGANQYLVKPFDLDELLSRVRNLLLLGPVSYRNDSARSAATRGSTDSFPGCHVNFDTFEVTRDGQKTRLTALQMKVLRYLMNSEGRVVPRGELLEKVWEIPATMQTRAPDQVIRQLRKICEADPANPRFLLTYRDAGYMFVREPEPDVASS